MHPVGSHAVARLRAEELRREAEQATRAFSGQAGDGRGRRWLPAQTWRRAVAVLGLTLLRLAGTDVVVVRIGGPRAGRARVARS